MTSITVRYGREGEVSSMELKIVSGADTAEIDRRIAEMYLKGHTAIEISNVIGMSSGSVGNRLAKMHRSGELPCRRR